MPTSVHAGALEAAQACAKRALELLETATAGGRDATFAVSGGTTPKLMFEALAAAGFNWSHVHLFFADERAVPPTDEQSNYKLAKENLIDAVGMPRRNVHRVHGELDADEAARRYREELSEHFELKKGQLPIFDIVHCGMGPDGHMASLFPGDAHVEDRTGLAASVFAPKLPHWRVTLLPGVLLAASNALMLVTGADKADTLRAVVRDEYDPFVHPAQLMFHEHRNAMWFLDQAAAARL